MFLCFNLYVLACAYVYVTDASSGFVSRPTNCDSPVCVRGGPDLRRPLVPCQMLRQVQEKDESNEDPSSLYPIIL